MQFLKNIKKVYKYSYGSRRYIVLYAFFSVIITIIGLITPILTSLQLVNLTQGTWKKVIIYSIFVFLLSIFDNIISFFIQFASEKFSKIVVSKIQIELGKEILKIRLEDIDKHSNGVFIQRLSSDASSLSSVFTYLVRNITNTISDLGAAIIVFVIDIKIGIFFIIYLILSVIFEKIIAEKMNKKDAQLRNQKENTTGFSTEIIRGIRDIKMLNAEKSFIKKVEENINNLNDLNYNMGYTNRKYFLFRSSLNKLFDLILVLLIVFLAEQNRFSVALGVVIYNYRYKITALSFDISYIFEFARNFNLSCKRVFSLFGSDEFKKEEFGSRHIDKIKGDFEFKNVDFSYDKQGKKVLNNMSFKVNSNETVAFVGKSGVGKTTIFNLLCKFYDVDSGLITIDGINIQDLDKDSIRSNITIISQNPYIFNMSIKDNLKLVKENLTDTEMKSACKMACLDEFIETLPNKYDTIIGEGGINLSGGQRQRLAIARALIQKTEIILFDEATSALDNKTQAQIQKAIDNMKNEYTILIIAHRLSTIINANRIILIDNGQVIAQGTHKKLLKECREYRELYENETIKN